MTRWWAAVLASFAVAGCGAGDAADGTAVAVTAVPSSAPPSPSPVPPPPPETAAPPPETTAGPRTTAAAPARAVPRTGGPPSSTAAAVAPATAPAPPAPRPTAVPAVTEPFEGSVHPIDDATAARMTASWRPGCPVGLADLRRLTVSHWGFDGRPRVGELVVHASHADAVVGAFAALFRARFPVEQMRLVDEFGADDDRSMAANNTSAFNCRRVAGSDRWSEHAFGTAIDVNPVQNPYVSRSGVSPPAGAAHTARQASTPGLITRDGPVVAAFAAIGWGWGGSWSSGKDYQHFSASGR